MHLEFALGKEGGRERDGQAANVLIGVNQPLVRGHPEAATDRDEIHCGQCEKYLKNQPRKHLLAGEVLDFLNMSLVVPQELHSIHLNIYIIPVDAIIKENVLKREMETLQLKILNRSLFVRSIKTFCFIL